MWCAAASAVQSETKTIAPNSCNVSYSTGKMYTSTSMRKYSQICDCLTYYGGSHDSHLQAVCRYLVASVQDNQYLKIIDAWKTCIAKTLGVDASKITYTNEPISE